MIIMSLIVTVVSIIFLVHIHVNVLTHVKWRRSITKEAPSGLFMVEKREFFVAAKIYNIIRLDLFVYISLLKVLVTSQLKLTSEAVTARYVQRTCVLYHAYCKSCTVICVLGRIENQPSFLLAIYRSCTTVCYLM